MQMILSQEEVEIKSKLWLAENGDFLEEQKCKCSQLCCVLSLSLALFLWYSEKTEGAARKG